MCRAAQVKFHKGLQLNMWRTYHGEQRTFQTFCANYHLKAFPASEDMLMAFAMYLDKHLCIRYATIYHYMAAICMEHISLGLPGPMENCLHLHKLLQAICRQQPLLQPDLGQQGITTEFLHHARPLHQLHLPKDSILWAACTLSHYGLFWSGKLAQPKLSEAGAVHFIRVWDVSLHFAQGCLHFVSIKLWNSKTDPFHQGCPIIIGCTGMAVCGACKAWCLVQSHRQVRTPPNALFL